MKPVRLFFSNLFQYLWINIIVSLALAVVVVATHFKNAYQIYALERLIYVLPLAIALYVPVALWIRYIFHPTWVQTPIIQKLRLAFASVILTAAFFCLRPLPLPDVEQEHHLVVIANGQKQEASLDSLVEIRSIRYLNGQEVPENAITTSADWMQSDQIYYSKGALASRLEIKGKMPWGVLLDLRHFEQGGRVQIIWDGVTQELDLYRAENAVAALRKTNFNWYALPPEPLLLVFWSVGLFALGVFLIIFLIQMGIKTLTGKYFSEAHFALLLAMVLLLLGSQKMAYLKIDQGRTFRDSISYVTVADQPLNSPAFWAGTRPFTLPLFLKLAGTNLSNYQTGEQLERIAFAQEVISIICWLALGLALSRSVHRRWLKLTLITLTLTFCLSPEISLWDSLLLSESLSFSTFALMLAGWVELVADSELREKPKLWWCCLGFTFLASVLYAFIRDSNVYFVLAGGVILGAGCWLLPQLKPLKAGMSLYALGVVVILLVQNLSLSGGNRWQVFIYDHLAMRILRDPAATEYFAAQGLPISETLLSTTQMLGFEYQKLLIEAPEMQPVRDWVECCGKSAYAGYLLSRPWQTLIEPLQNYPRLLNGDNIEYRNPRFDVRPLPVLLAEYNGLFFNHQLWVLVVWILVQMGGLVWFAVRRRQPLWLVLAVLTLSLYPMMFMIWHAEPMEIERHAAQIGVQFRLAGWLALVLLGVDGLCGLQRRVLRDREPILPVEGDFQLEFNKRLAL